MKPCRDGPVSPLRPSPGLVRLLATCGLPVEDVDEACGASFFGLCECGVVLASVGVELFHEVGLLRSLAVDPALRGRGCGGLLLCHAETFAAARGVGHLYLLTTTAGAYFRSRGYSATPRAEAPRSIRAARQFSELCPNNAEFLSKRLLYG